MNTEELLALLREMRSRMADHGDDYAVQRIDAALAKAEKPADEPPIGNCRLCGPRTREQTVGVYGHGEKLFVCSRCGVTIRGADSAPVVEKLRGDEE